MVEAGAREVSEDDMLEALMFGHEAIKKLIAFEEEIIKEIGIPTMEYEKLEITDELKNEVDTYVRERLDKALRIKDKLEKYATIDSLQEEVIEKYKLENRLPDDALIVEIKEGYHAKFDKDKQPANQPARTR